ncbi:putative RNA-dependent RNA polymerase [Rhizoctonia solani mitovirus 25]|uniref:RNA-dependent RNA polymerase n=1 Tax=Rhizoctonia solani mitovirus 25 TaxID=2599416 RepID=A0ABX5Y6Y0_9VIRU|nr:putative RNA-dependent RNA polymerase [Rhizoctonia solani mitovirus 25]QDW65415.1 putative RNA-dependent RNA polymerase [Rhizoctonia solani mitovirus 25]
MKAKFTIFSHFGRLPVGLVKGFNAMLGLKARPLLQKVLLGVAAACKVRVSKSKILCLALMVNRISYVRRRNGPKGLTLYLKSAFVLYQQALGGQVLPDTAAIGKVRVSRNNRGIPRIIPAHLRQLCRMEDISTMKWISSILNIYRDIDFEGAPKLSTITNGYEGEVGAVARLQPYIKPFLGGFLSFNKTPLTKLPGLIKWDGRRLFMIWKAAPGMLKQSFFGTSNYSTHPHNVLRAFISLYKRPETWSAFVFIAKAVNHRGVLALIKEFLDWQLDELPGAGAIGKLHAKKEPAGKVRLFAMADAPTQWVLYPLHELIMEHLRPIPQDGTFNQTAPLKYLVDCKELYSYDLTAATDRLPITLQIRILGVMFGGSFAEAWATLLVDRPYGFYQTEYSKYQGTYKYAVGQPMGAYSSWAMLALTHHFLVQTAAMRATVIREGEWFTQYAVLGDDLVIGDGAVAKEYLKLLKELGMPVNVFKSLVSLNGSCMEFAKRTIYKGKDISPIALKEMSAAQSLAPAMIQFAVSHALSLPELLASFRFGWRNISWLSKPLNKLPSQIRTLVLTMNQPKTFEELPTFFNLGVKSASTFVADLIVIGENFGKTEVQKLVDKVARKYSAVMALFDNMDDLVEEIEKSTPLALFTKGFETGKFPMSKVNLIRGEGFVMIGAVGEDDSNIIVPQAQINQNITDFALNQLTETQLEGIHGFMFVLFYLLQGRYISDYKEVVLLVWRDLKALAGQYMNLSNSDMLVQRPTLKSQTEWKLRGGKPAAAGDPVEYGFFHRYWDTLLALDELASLSPASLEFSRPEGDEGIALGYNSVTPAQVRYYRLWSGILQGNSPLLSLSLRTPKVTPTKVVPREHD